MKIGLCGTMSVGKTTLVKALAKTDKFKKYNTVTERSKYLRDLGIPLNTDSTINGQLVFLAERSSELLHENILTDRTIWDVSAFTMLAKSIATHEKSQFVNTAMLLKDQYDIVFYISPEGVEIEDNGVREIDSEYRDKIDETIVALINRFPPKRLVNIKGTTEERIALVLEAFYKYL